MISELKTRTPELRVFGVNHLGVKHLSIEEAAASPHLFEDKTTTLKGIVRRNHQLKAFESKVQVSYPELANLLSRLQKIAGETDVVGLKGRDDSRKKICVPHPYFKSIAQKLQRLKTRAVRLEDNAHGTILDSLHYALLHATSENKLNSNYIMSQLELPKHPREHAIRQTIERMLYSRPSDLDKQTHFTLLREAICFERSLQMCEAALRKGITHLIVGAAHAADIQTLGLVKPAFVGNVGDSNALLADAEFRKKVHSFYSPALDRIRLIATIKPQKKRLQKRWNR
ncbi:TPA: hypothetical protein HA318_05010 [Candidatus Micrarchaeota archaeon]|nr:MAG: hypothetical protein AUJ65_01565 [Candidatus Micrarchaeota archaeon CG1_02_51_15]HII39332.1 hypothetical protein [Candidatus Micrarchaeota archaeon]